MTDKEKSTDIQEMFKDTSCYTYKVTMLIQVLAPTQDVADAKLDQDGGYISKREVEYVSSTLLYKNNPEKEETLIVKKEKDI